MSREIRCPVRLFPNYKAQGSGVFLQFKELVSPSLAEFRNAPFCTHIICYHPKDLAGFHFPKRMFGYNGRPWIYQAFDIQGFIGFQYGHVFYKTKHAE